MKLAIVLAAFASVALAFPDALPGGSNKCPSDNWGCNAWECGKECPCTTKVETTGYSTYKTSTKTTGYSTYDTSTKTTAYVTETGYCKDKWKPYCYV